MKRRSFFGTVLGLLAAPFAAKRVCRGDGPPITRADVLAERLCRSNPKWVKVFKGQGEPEYDVTRPLDDMIGNRDLMYGQPPAGDEIVAHWKNRVKSLHAELERLNGGPLVK